MARWLRKTSCTLRLANPKNTSEKKTPPMRFWKPCRSNPRLKNAPPMPTAPPIHHPRRHLNAASRVSSMGSWRRRVLYDDVALLYACHS
eukprot:9471719-Pyramimonas_sp.AAC.1